MAVRQFLRTNWRGVTIGVTALVIFCGVILLLSTMPPRAIAMATGPEGSGYEEIGTQYQIWTILDSIYARARRRPCGRMR
jgi:hypothetical protein